MEWLWWWTAEGYQLEMVQDHLYQDLKNRWLVWKGETRDLNLTFPENYGVADLAGADVIFQVTVHHIASKVQAQLDEEFVKSFQMPDVETVEDFKKKVRESLENQNAQTLRAEKEIKF